MSVLLVSHKLEDVIALCDEAVVLRAGRLVGGAHMPATKAELVALMFGQELAAQSRQRLTPGQEVLLLDEVTVRGKRVTVENFTMQIRAGEVIGLAGLEDSGQELVLRACAGLVRPVRGRVFVGRRDMTGKPYRQFMAAGVAFGAAGRLEEGLIAGLTLTEHVALTAGNGALLDWAGARQTTEAKINHYNVRGTPESRIEQLSGGNQQRVLMAMLPDKPLLLALEQPTRGLDVDSARWIWEQLLARRAAGAAIIFTSPDFDELTTYSDRIFVAHAGILTQIKDATKTNTTEMGRMMSGEVH
jgi:simple sugar transport system ATP-binding protein